MNVDMTPLILVADSHYEQMPVPVYTYTYLRDDGNFEWEFVLEQRPESHVFEFFYESEGLEFYFQDPELLDDVEYSTPDSCMYSYAAYHATRKDNYRFSTGHSVEYETGKAFHIYRPKAWDSSGDTVWCSMQIKDGIFRIELPEDFLDNAVYPVTVDPTFGHSSVGVNEVNPSTGSIGSIGTQAHGGASTETIVQTSLYARTSNIVSGGAYTVYAALYTITSTLPVTRVYAANLLWNTAGATASAAWRNSGAYSWPLSNGVTYCIAFGDYVNPSNQRVYTDVGTGTQRSQNNDTTLPSTWTSGSTSASMYSFYATYDVSGTVTDKFGANIKFGAGVKGSK